MSPIRPLIPLLIAAGILIGGNGLQGTFISLRASQEGFSTSLIGVIGAGYNIGFAIGCIYVTRILRSMLYEVTTTDPWTYVAMTAALAVAVLAASWLPAIRAAGVDPVTALRR